MGSIGYYAPQGTDEPRVKGEFTTLLAEESRTKTTNMFTAIVANGKSFALNGKNMSYRFHVDDETGDLMSDHFGGLVTEDPAIPGTTPANGWSTTSHRRREFPELGKGDFRNPAVFLKHHEGFTVSHFKYQSYEVVDGKPEFSDLPATFGEADEVKTLVVRMYDSHSHVQADLIYSIFVEHDAIVRRVVLTNKSENTVTVEKMASLSIDLPYAEYDMVGLRGEWTRERSQFRRKVDYGMHRLVAPRGCDLHDADRTKSQLWQQYGILVSFLQSIPWNYIPNRDRVPRRRLGLLVGVHRFFCC